MTTLHLAKPDDVDAVADIIADAFMDLAVIAYLVPDPERRRQVSRGWYRLFVEHAIAGAGKVFMTADGTAAAVWLDRTGEVTEPAEYAKHLAEIAGPDLPQFERLDRQMEFHHPSDPHWHLLFLAVRPEQQRRGLGSALLNHSHAWLDDAGLPAYLEATGEANRKLYREHGYTDSTPETLTVSGDIVLYRQWRPARAA